MAAPICATSFAGPSRSSRAISDACRLAGTARAGDGMAAAVRCAAPSLPASSTALVISSTNKGMPSVRSMMSWRMLAGRDLLPTTRSIMALDFALRQPIDGESRHVRPSDPGRLELWPERHDQQHAKACESGQRCDRTLPGSWGRSNAHPRRSSAPDFAVPALPSGKRALPAFSVGAARGSDRASDNVRRSAATASRQIVPRPQSRSRSAPAPHRACRASLARCRREQIRRRVPSD